MTAPCRQMNTSGSQLPEKINCEKKRAGGRRHSTHWWDSFYLLSHSFGCHQRRKFCFGETEWQQQNMSSSCFATGPCGVHFKVTLLLTQRLSFPSRRALKAHSWNGSSWSEQHWLHCALDPPSPTPPNPPPPHPPNTQLLTATHPHPSASSIRTLLSWGTIEMLCLAMSSGTISPGVGWGTCQGSLLSQQPAPNPMQE